MLYSLYIEGMKWVYKNAGKQMKLLSLKKTNENKVQTIKQKNKGTKKEKQQSFQFGSFYCLKVD